MNTNTKVLFIIGLSILAFTSMGMSQTIANTGVSHVLCWLSAFLALGGWAWLVASFDD
jgi:hypothetical protein